MTREETKEILKAVQAYYQNFSPKDMTATLGIWTMALEDYDYKDVSQALLLFFKTDEKGYAPVPGQIIAMIHKVKDPEPMNEEQAFGMIMRAIERSSWHSDEEFDKLPDLLKRVVGDSNQLKDWAKMNVEDIERYVQPNVVRTYRIEAQREQEYQRLPDEVRMQIDMINPPRIYSKSESVPQIETKPLPPEESTIKIEEARKKIAEQG